MLYGTLRYPYLYMVSMSLHVNLYKYKQSHVSDVLDARMAYISKFSGI